MPETQVYFVTLVAVVLAAIAVLAGFYGFLLIQSIGSNQSSVQTIFEAILVLNFLVILFFVIGARTRHGI